MGTTKALKKAAAVAVGVATAVWLSGSVMLVPVAHGQTVEELQAQIQALLAQIAALQAQLANLQGGGAVADCGFTRDLTVGSTGDDVQCLQRYLNSDPETKLADSGPGSPGNETKFFGPLTRNAVIRWQNKYAAQVLAPLGLSAGTGYWGPSSRSYYSTLVAQAPAPSPAPQPETGGEAPAGTASTLTVALAPDQPAPGLFGENFASRKFTKLLFTASADGNATVKALTVKRTGQGSDAAFSGVVLLDEDGVRLGDAKTFGSNSTARLPDKFVVKAGETKVIYLAGDSDNDQNAYAGQLVSLTLVGVEVEGDTVVNANLPLTGTAHTVNDTLSIGSLTLSRGALDPGSGATKEIGTKGYIFSGLQLTAGSSEDVLVKSIRWNQSGSAAASDLANVVTVFDGVEYPTEVSADGKYYTSKFGDGVKITKGNSKQMYIKGDIVGGSNRTVDFDLFRYADLQVKGLTYGYTLLPSATETAADNDDDGEFQNAQPRYDAFQVEIGAGTITVEKATEIPSQNVAENLDDQPLGGIVVDVKGEPVSVAAINFDVSLTEAAGTGGSIDTDDITNITLVRRDTGEVVAGPVDGVAGGNNAIQFSDTVTFPVGRTVYELRGKLSTDFSQNDQITASTTPSADWTTVTGVISGQNITPSPSSAVTLSTMTVKTAALTITMHSSTASSSPDQYVVAGTNAYPFAKYVLDASESGEDLRVTSMQLDLTTAQPDNANDDLTNCALYDGNTQLNTGSNVVNPSNSDSAGHDYTFNFDTGLIIPKGTVKVLTLKCNLIAGADLTMVGWGLGHLATPANAAVVTGVTSGTSVAEKVTTDNGRTIIVKKAGELGLALDSSSPSLKLVQAGATDQTLAVLRLNAKYEDIKLTQLGLQIATSGAASGQANASNSPSDLSKVTLWDGSTKLGEVVFTDDYATATLSLVIPKDTQKLLTIKADIAPVGVTLSEAIPGHLINVDYDAGWGDAPDDDANEGKQGGKATGLSSGQTIYIGGSDTSSNGARIVKAVPTVTKIPTSGTFSNTSDQVLYRFKISAPAGTNGISLYKFSFNVSTNTTAVTDYSSPPVFKVTNFRVYCYSDSGFSNPSCGSSSGQLNQFGLVVADGSAGNVDFDDGVTNADPDVEFGVRFNPTATSGATPEAVVIPAGETRWFELKADVTGASSSPSIATKLLGDAAWIGLTCNADNEKLSVSHCDYGTDTNSGSSYFTGVASLLSATGASSTTEMEDDFIWSDNATNTSQSVDSPQWMNGFLVPGLPTISTAAEVVTF